MLRGGVQVADGFAVACVRVLYGSLPHTVLLAGDLKRCIPAPTSGVQLLQQVPAPTASKQPGCVVGQTQLHRHQANTRIQLRLARTLPQRTRAPDVLHAAKALLRHVQALALDRGTRHAVRHICAATAAHECGHGSKGLFGAACRKQVIEIEQRGTECTVGAASSIQVTKAAQRHKRHQASKGAAAGASVLKVSGGRHRSCSDEQHMRCCDAHEGRAAPKSCQGSWQTLVLVQQHADLVRHKKDSHLATRATRLHVGWLRDVFCSCCCCCC